MACFACCAEIIELPRPAFLGEMNGCRSSSAADGRACVLISNVRFKKSSVSGAISVGFFGRWKAPICRQLNSDVQTLDSP